MKAEITKASDLGFSESSDISEEVFHFFKELANKYNNTSFIININFMKQDDEADAEIIVYDYYVE